MTYHLGANYDVLTLKSKSDFSILYSIMNILITGSRGFIGRHLVPYLENLGHSITEIDREIGRDVISIDEQDLKDIDVVIHLAEQTSVWNEKFDDIIDDNIKSFIHIFCLCKKHNIKFIYCSSSCSINVTSLYGLSKQFEDKFADIYGWGGCVGLRLHNVYGKNPREDTLLGYCMRDSITLWNRGYNMRHFTYIEDACEGIVRALQLNGGLYNIANPESNLVLEFVKEVSKYKSLKINIINEIREHDKIVQVMDNSIPNIIRKNYINIHEGIKKTLIN